MTLSTALSYFTRAQSILTETLQKVEDQSPESKKTLYLVEQAQRIHEVCHRICSDSTQPYITDEAQQRVLSEVGRLKEVIKNQKNLIYKLQTEIVSTTNWDY